MWSLMTRITMGVTRLSLPLPFPGFLRFMLSHLQVLQAAAWLRPLENGAQVNVRTVFVMEL